MFKFRPYQTEANNMSIERLAAGVTRQLFCLPTGTGKTPLIAGFKKLHNIDKRQMVLVHREELATQAKAEILEWNPTLRVGIEMADSYASDSDDVVVASVPTIGRAASKRLVRFKRNEFGLITVDEAHHATANSYKTVFNHFGCLDHNSSILLTGVTATPNRADSQGLGQVFDEIVYQYSILEAIRQGYLVNIRGIKLSTRTSLDSVTVSAGDFDAGSLGRTVNTPERNRLTVRKWQDVALGRPTVAFCATVQHSQDLAQAFNDAGIKAAAIWDGCGDRSKILAAHRAGLIQVVTNCGILTEGYNDWRISCIIMACPTKSALKFTQCVGRGTRIPYGIDNLIAAINRGDNLVKVDCIVLDVVDATSKHSLTTLASLFGLAPKADLNGKTITEALEIVDTVKARRPEIILDDMKNINQLVTSEVDLFKDKTPTEIQQNTKLKWMKIKDTEYKILLPMGESVSVYKDLLDKWSIRGVVCGTGIGQTGINALPEAFAVADRFITMFGKGLLNSLRLNPLPQKSTPQKLSPKASAMQIDFISRLYAKNEKVMANINSLTMKEASSLIQSFGKKIA